MRPKIVLVTPRPPQGDGTGDQRRAQDIVDALTQVSDLEVISWLPPGQGLPLPRSLIALARVVKLALFRPLQVALVQAGFPPDTVSRMASADLAVLVTNRAAPGPVLPAKVVVDFVDDLATVLLRRSEHSGAIKRRFWKLESRRTRAYDRKLLASAAVAVAHSRADAGSLGTAVRAVELAARMEPMEATGDKVLFLGNLYYHPNEEAAMWICRHLAPELAARGIDPSRIVVCGRKPSRRLRICARQAGVDLRPDVPDTPSVMKEAAVVLCPTVLGTGAITKVIDAVGARRPTVISPLANEGLDLEEGISAFVRPREVEAFAGAVEALLGSPALRISMAEAAFSAFKHLQPSAVSRAWQDIVLGVLKPAATKVTPEG